MEQSDSSTPGDNMDIQLRNVTRYLQQGLLEQAESLATRLRETCPDHADLNHLLGMIKGMQGHYQEGIELVRNAISLAPHKAVYFNNLGFLLHLHGDLEQALSACERALEINPGLADAHNTHSVILKDLGRRDQALAACEQALRIRPQFAQAHHTRSVILKELGKPGQALAACERAIQIMPGLAEAHNTRSTILNELGRHDEALSACDRAIQLRPGFAEAYNNRGSLLLDTGHLEQALSSCEQAIRSNPDNASAYYNRANILGNMGRYREAEADYRRTLELQPGNATAHSNLVFMLAALAELPPERMLDELRAWDRAHGRQGRLQRYVHTARRPAGGKTRIGYVSPDFRRHPVSYFFEPLLSAHDHSRFEIFCYASHQPSRSDDTTTRLRKMADHWREVHGIDDEALAQQIHDDRIDILVDLAGHTRDNRLRAFTYRPAPVQATYLGFFASSGLEAMDYWITDEIIHPANTIEPATEKIYRLPRCSFCYAPPAEMPDIAPRPDSGDHITFGSFNHLSKLTPAVIETWSAILGELPASRLVIMDAYLGDPATCRRLHRLFSDQGIADSRIELRGRKPFRQYLATYAEIDIVLDAFPRTGGTTTAEALWNGVPVVTLAGLRYVERISASKLVAVGLDDLIAGNCGEYVGIAVSLARNYSLRKELRTRLRTAMQHSQLGDREGLARAMENAYLQMQADFLSSLP